MSQAAIVEAHRRLRPTGMAPYPLAEGLAILADVAAYLASNDPIEIGAGYLLELEGYERTREQLALPLDAATDVSRPAARVPLMARVPAGAGHASRPVARLRRARGRRHGRHRPGRTKGDPMPDTTETSQAERFKNRYAARLAHSLAIDPDDVEISDAFAAYLFALDLIAGDSERCKAGYSPSNALLAAIEVFGISVGEGVAARLGIPFESPATGGATNLEDRDAPERSGGGSQCRCR